MSAEHQANIMFLLGSRGMNPNWRNPLMIYKTLSFALIALSFGACAATNATHSTATASDATHSATMDIARSDLDVSDAPGQSITPSEAKNRIGRRMTVCGVIVSANYAARSRMSPTFLNLDEPYPRQIFTVLIWGEDREKFGKPEISLKEKRICVSGLIEEYQGVPRIVLRNVDQLSEDVD
jgi:hypothetical protein